MGLAVWGEDEAGPHQSVPYPGESWQPDSHPVCQPHEYLRNGTAMTLTMFHPATGKVRVKRLLVRLHPWLKEPIKAILKTLPEKTMRDEETNRLVWQAW